LRSGCGVGATLSVTESPHRVRPSDKSEVDLLILPLLDG
jgi:hypothetical protein